MAEGSKKQVVFLVFMALIVALAVVGFLVKDRNAHKIITVNDKAPEFQLTAMNGRTVNLSEFRGKTVMVHFWATWCPPCVEEIPTLDRLYRSFAGKDFEMLAVSVDEGGPASVGPFLQKNRLSLPVLFDPDRRIAALYGTYKFPETYLIDRNGVVRHKVIGPQNWDDPVNIAVLADLIGSR